MTHKSYNKDIRPAQKQEFRITLFTYRCLYSANIFHRVVLKLSPFTSVPVPNGASAKFIGSQLTYGNVFGV